MSVPGRVVLGLDTGTTAAKASAFGVDRPWRTSTHREYPLIRPRPGWEVQDPDVIVDAAFAALAETAGRVRGADVVALALSSAMHGLIGLDAHHRPLTPLLTWADSRAAGVAADLRSSGRAAELHRVSGTPVHPMSPLTKLMWFRRAEPALSARVRHWVGLKEWIVLQLTGRLAAELSCASGTGLLDVRRRDWSRPILDLAGVDPEQLAPVHRTTDAVALSPAAADRAGLPAGLPVVLGGGDGPLGNLGTGALRPGVAGLSLGTSGALRMAVREPAVEGGGPLFCYALTDDVWVLGGAVSNGGVVVRWCGDVFGADLGRPGGVPPDAELLELVGTVPAGSDGLVMLPYLLAERSPLWDPELGGAFLGVRRHHTRAHFVRAAVEGVALQLSLILAELDAVEPVRQVRATGGVFRSAVWRRILAGALDRPLTVTGGAEGSALGAAALGLVSVGLAADPIAAMTLLTGETGDTGDGPDDRTDPVPGDVAAYRAVRDSVGPLLEQLRPVGELFAGCGTATTVVAPPRL